MIRTPLFTIGLLALTLTARAQSSNLVQSIRLTFVNEAGVTNNTTINVSAREAEGFLLNFTKDVMVATQATNPPPTFQQSIRQTTQQVLLNTLARQAREDESQSSGIAAVATLLPGNLDLLSREQKQYLRTNLLPTLQGQ